MAESVGSDSIVLGDNTVVHKLIADYPGGAELDVSGVGTEYDSNNGYIPAGTPIVKDGTAFKPFLEADLQEETLPTVVGILYQPVAVAKPYASIAIKAVVNESKLPFVLSDEVKAMVPGISFY